MTTKRLKVDSLLLDTGNPRIAAASDQRDALTKVISDQGSKLVTLAESIAQDGLSPSERFIVMPAPRRAGKYIVLEGNRRLAALKMLYNPAVLGDLPVSAAYRRRIEKIAQGFGARSVGHVDCYVVPDRAAATHWIQQKHTGENEGRGIVAWSGVARGRFRGQHPALQALDFALERGSFSDQERATIAQRFPITTLERLLGTPSVRAQLGFEISTGRLMTQLPDDEALKPLQKIIKDLSAGTVNVTKLKNKSQQEAYVKSLGKNLPDLSKLGGQPREILSGANDAAPPSSGSARPRSRPTAPRKVLIPKQAALHVTVEKVAEILKELQTLKLEQAPHAISVLFRVFLEISVDHYISTNNIPANAPTQNNGNVKKSLKTKIEESINHMISVGVDRNSLDGIRQGKDNKQSPLFIDTLNNYVHNRFFSPSERELRIAWDNSAPFFQTIWK